MKQLSIVVTTIQTPTTCMEKLSACAERYDAQILVIGDRKGPQEYDLPRTLLFTLDNQHEMPYRLPALLPTDHYARKNLGYLYAMHHGSGCIYETDDDNFPLESWKPRDVRVHANRISKNDWLNIYHLYSSELIWPRGLPLERIHEPPPGSAREQSIVEVEAPIQQGLINGSPDVDAIWRHIFDHPVTFSDGPSQFLASGTWCPFNSQSTWWWPMAYPLMYLPSYCSFRMTDIWRSFVAQRCLWELDLGIAFHSPEAVQERNQHNLKQDFLDEVPGYENNSFMSDWLEGTQLEGSVGSTGRNLLKCYASLVDKGVFPGQELPLVEAWLQDLNQDGHTLA